MRPFDDDRRVPDAVRRIVDESEPSTGLHETPLDAVDGIPRAALRQGTLRLDRRLAEPDVLFSVTRRCAALHRTPRHMFFAATPAVVEDLFGRPPALLGSWAPLDRAGRLELGAVLRERSGGADADVDPVAAGVAPPPGSDRLVLAIGCTHATELSTVDFHDLDPARAFVLTALGYDAADVADLLSTSLADATRLVARGWETMRRVKWVDSVSGHLLDGLDPHGPALDAREGRRYRVPDGLGGLDDRGPLTYRGRDDDGRHRLARPDDSTVSVEGPTLARLTPVALPDDRPAGDEVASRAGSSPWGEAPEPDPESADATRSRATGTGSRGERGRES